MRLETIIGLWILATAYNVVILALWWLAAFGDWEVTVKFANFNEQWVEGILLHLSLLVPLAAALSLLRLRLRRRDRRQEILGGGPVALIHASNLAEPLLVLRWFWQPVARCFSVNPQRRQ